MPSQFLTGALLILLLLNTGHPSGMKQDAVILMAVESALPGKHERASFLLGGSHYVYSEQDWSKHQRELAEALNETYWAISLCPPKAVRDDLARGYSLLFRHVSALGFLIHRESIRPASSSSLA